MVLLDCGEDRRLLSDPYLVELTRGLQEALLHSGYGPVLNATRGTLQSLEFVAYTQALKNHIKSQWHWMPTATRFVAQVQITILPSGVVQDARIVSSSGSGNFDDSVLRAVYKSSPVPLPPQNLYQQFREVRITFDSHD